MATVRLEWNTSDDLSSPAVEDRPGDGGADLNGVESCIADEQVGGGVAFDASVGVCSGFVEYGGAVDGQRAGC